jgi:non-canonical purine NTP pyrophosphatase (RdgB/HAM1 family)
MQEIIFATGNEQKFTTALHACGQYDIKLIQQDVDTPEIQSEDPEAVAIDKARKAYQIVQKPVVITDDSWHFSGLKGFPGVYMHSINHWFTPEDFLRLVMPLKDRAVTMTQYLVYCDGSDTKVICQKTHGTLLKEIRGTSPHPSHTVIALETDNGLSIAEAYAQAADKSSRATAKIWKDFAEWLTTTKT